MEKNNKTLFNRLKQLRGVLNVNQSYMAKILGLSNSNYASIETGKINISDKKLVKLHNSLGVNLHWLLTGEGSMFADKEVTGDVLILNRHDFETKMQAAIEAVEKIGV